MTPPCPDLLIVLSGGAGRRLGVADKASLVVGSQRLLDRAVASAAGRPVVLVGPEVPVPDGVAITREQPAGGGPAAGVAAGAALIADLHAPEPDAVIGILAVDHAGVTARTWRRLTGALGDGRCATLASDGRRQIGVAVVRWAALTAAIATQPSWHNQPLRRLIDPLVDVELPADVAEVRDIDTLADLEWWRERAADE